MTCAYSFSSVIVLVVGVSFAALILIIATDDICPETSSRCEEDDKCISNRRFCNGEKDCANNSDEAKIRCGDMAGIQEYFQRSVKIHTRIPISTFLNTSCMRLTIADADTSVQLWNPSVNHTDNSTTSNGNDYPYNIHLKKFPTECKTYLGDGIMCEHQNWSEIPWNKFDMNTNKLHLNKVINANALSRPEHNSKIPFLVKHMFLENNLIPVLADGSFCHLKCMLKMHLQNNTIRYIGQSAFCEMKALIWLDLSNNKLDLKGFRFRGMPELEDLFLQNNEIEELSDHLFRELKSLHILNLRNNSITYIGGRAFRYNLNLTDLYLSNNKITQFEPFTFAGQKRLQRLYIGHNKFSHLPNNIFADLGSLQSLSLEDIEVDVTDIELFRQTPRLDFVNFKKFQYCRYVPKASRCYPVSDGFSSIRDLLDGKPLRLAVWTIAVLTIIGNIAILITRTGPYWRSRKRPTILDIFVNNLAGADFLMGIYLLTLAVKDLQFRNAYNVHAYEWSTSNVCSAIGILAMISSEASLLILTLMSLERYIVISRPFAQEYRLSKTQARIAVGIIWIFVTALALVPVLMPYHSRSRLRYLFLQWSGKSSYFGSSGLCFPMHLDDENSFGWQYTAFVFIGLNSICLVFITAAYGSLFFEIRKSNLSNPVAVKDMEMAIRLFFTVATDFICWAPIIVLKLMVLNGYPLPKELISWVLIFVLPLNSAINPFLYTFSTGEVRVKLIQYFTVFPEDNKMEQLTLPCSSPL